MKRKAKDDKILTNVGEQLFNFLIFKSCKTENIVLMQSRSGAVFYYVDFSDKMDCSLWYQMKMCIVFLDFQIISYMIYSFKYLIIKLYLNKCTKNRINILHITLTDKTE